MRGERKGIVRVSKKEVGDAGEMLALLQIQYVAWRLRGGEGGKMSR